MLINHLPMLDQDKISVIQNVALKYWGSDLSQGNVQLSSIKIVKVTGGKVMGFFPAYSDFPEVFFKVYFFDRGFQFESDGLIAANSMAEVPGVQVPKVVAIFPEYRTVLIKKNEWQDSSSELRRFFVQSLNIDWKKVGLWLRNFHDSRISLEKNEYFLKKKIQKIESHMEALRTLFTDSQRAKMNSIIQIARDYLSTNKCEWVISHGDFGLDNIKVAGKELHIIDFEDCQMAPREFDLLNLLTRLEYTRYFPNNKGVFDKIRDQFLDGYGLELSFTPIYDFLYLLISLDLIESYHRRRRAISGWTYKQVLYQNFEWSNIRKLEKWLDIVNEKS